MVTEADIEVRIDAEADIVRARASARDFSRRIGFGAIDQSRITTAVSELTRNVVRYATDGRGIVHVRRVQQADGRSGIEVVVADEGPGIEDVTHAMRDGTTSGRSLGLGLPGTRRLMDEMDIQSSREGTIVTIKKWLR